MLAAFGLAACGGSGGGDGSDPTAGSPDEVRNRVVAWYPIGNSANDRQNFDIGRGIPQSGWAQFVNGTVIPQISSRGLSRVMLHNPFGIVGNEQFQFDQFLRARDQGRDELTADFVSAWRPVTNSGTEVIAVIGTPRLDPDSQNVLQSQGPEAFRNWGLEAIGPMLDAGMSLLYDAAAPAAEDSADLFFARETQRRGSRTYIEATPPAENTWWFDFPVLIREFLWQQRLSNPNFASRAQLTDEILRLPRIEPGFVRNNPGDRWPPEMCRIIAEGDTVVVEDHLLVSPQRTIEGLAECAAALR